MTKTVRNGLRIDVLVDTQGPDGNGKEEEMVTVWSGVVVQFHAVAYVGKRQRFQVKVLDWTQV